MGANAAGGDRSLHVPSPDMEAYLEWIGATFDVVPLRELGRRVAGGGSLRGLAAVTFDDAYRGVYRHAAPLLRKLGVPATVFVIPDAIESPDYFWWDLLAARDGFDDADRRACLDELRGDRDSCLARYAAPARELGPDFLPAGWEEIRAALDVLEVGSHSCSHRNLTALDPAELRDELARSAARIRDRLPESDSDYVAYPYGLHDSRVLDAAREAGYRGGVILAGRTTAAGDDPHALPRINVPAGLSRAGIECRAADIESLLG